ncbi:MAG TPA: MucB/RseB C-terminal domain-containing protein [Burkholderiales bacterium]
MSRLLFAALAAGSLFYGAAVQAQEYDPLQWLERMYSASKHLSYSGTFLYQHGDQIETSRITRLVDQSGVHERLETLDGIPREIVRDNDEVTCYLPRSMTVKIDNRRETSPFPHVRAEHLEDITKYYDVRKGGIDRIAGHEAQSITLQPRDDLRYGHRLWAEVESGLLLKAKTFNEKNQQVEQFAFTQLQIGGKIERQQVKSQYADQGKNWRVESSAMTETDLSKLGWTLKDLPPGYKKVTELKRRVGESYDVGHVVISDGLAAVSVFIEPLGAKPGQPVIGHSRQGALNIYTRNIDNHLVTVIGEVPAGSVRQIADAVEHRPSR